MSKEATKEYAETMERLVGPSSINKVTFGKQAKRIEGEWDVRWVWSIEVSAPHRDKTVEGEWAGFKTLPACLADLDREIKNITKEK